MDEKIVSCQPQSEATDVDMNDRETEASAFEAEACITETPRWTFDYWGA